MSSDQRKYGDNRNLWRKLYPVGSPRQAPKNITVTDSQTNQTFTLDLQKTIRHRDYFQIFNSQSVAGIAPAVLVLGEYDEGLVIFNNTTTANFSFNFTFSGTPVAVFSMEAEAGTVSNTTNINIFGTNINTTGGTIGTSAPFSGTIRYRAAYAASYPSYFTSSYAPSSGTFRASAGTTIPSNQSAYTASWAALATNPTVFYQTPFDDGNTPTYTADVALIPDANTFTPNSVASDISAPVSVSINYIAYE